MGLGTLTIGTSTFLDVGNGRYVQSAVVFGGPRNEIRITPGRVSKGPNDIPQTSMSIVHLFEKDVTVGSTVSRRLLTYNTQVIVHEGLTVAEIDAVADRNATLIDAAFLNKVLSGAS